jgi:NAD-dependent dihydropyrimidine dehydrogenase PreA subunit
MLASHPAPNGRDKNTKNMEVKMSAETDDYRNLQEHLDRMPVGYPATKSGVEINLLKAIFTPEQAKIATHLDHKHKTVDQIFETAKEEIGSKDELKRILDEIVSKGGIHRRERDGKEQYALMPLLLWGMFEHQLKRLTPEFLMNLGQYMQGEFGYELASAKLPRIRVIPIERSIDFEHRIATYDELRYIIERSGEHITIQECMCRKMNDMMGKPCQVTDRRELCMSFGDLADLYAKEGWGRKISQEEALEIARKNEEEGLVLQPGNEQEPVFMCACCGDCCGVLGPMKSFPAPVDLVASNYYAQVNTELCKGQGTCVERCPMDAVKVEERLSCIDLARCIGCGLCVPTCPENAIRLVKKSEQTVPPKTEEDLYDAIKAGKKLRKIERSGDNQ